MFGLIIKDSVYFKPEFLMRGSEYGSILKMRGYEYYGFFDNHTRFMIRGSTFLVAISFDNTEIVNTTMKMPDHRQMIASDTTGMLTFSIPRSNVFSNQNTIYRLKHFLFVSIIESVYRNKVAIFGEKNTSFSAYITPLINVTPLIYDVTLGNATLKFVRIDAASYYGTDILGFVCNYGIILLLPSSLTPYMSEPLNIKVT